MTGISVSLKKDNWNQFAYNERILDSLASLFHVSSKCTAIIRYQNKLYISYSDGFFLPDTTKTPIKKEIIYNKTRYIIEFQVAHIFDAIHNNAPFKALALYLLLNQDFVDVIEKAQKMVVGINIKDSKQQKAVLEKFKTLVADPAFHQLPQYETKEIEQDVVVNREHKALLEALNLFAKNLKDLRKQLNKPQLPSSYESLVENYENIITTFKECNDLTASNEEQIVEIKEQLVRPKQDILKIFHHIDLGYEIRGHEILDNMEGIHAEINMTIHFPDISLLESNYIGTSKLCCGFCHEFLNRKGYGHRGTHGICDPKWQLYLSPQSDNFMQEVAPNLNSSEAEILDPGAFENYPNQWKRLSTDNFEKLVAQSKRSGYPEQWTLHKLKEDLGLNPSFGKTISDLFHSLGSSINYCCSKLANIYTEVNDLPLSEQHLIGSSEA